MKKGFFSSSKIQSEQALSKIPRCGLCGLYKTCLSPKMPPTGKGKKKILIVAEAPGSKEDKLNTQLIGVAGQLLRRSLRRVGIDLDRDCWKTNAIICRPKENQTPDDIMIEACRPNLTKTIKKYKPNVILLLGLTSIKSLLPTIWKGEIGAMSKWVGWSIPCQNPNAWIVPTYHPSYLLRKNEKVLSILFEKHLRLAVKKSKSRPWKEVPSYKKQIEIILNPSQASKRILEIMSKGGKISFDYETNCLKPDGEGPEIISCSICWKGRKTIAFPWYGEVKHSMDRLLKTSMPKIASNLKFEDRWTRAVMGHPVRNWLWDTMIAAHVIDNRTGVTSLKFQSFVLLGAESYDDHIKPYLKSGKNNRFNRIKELDIKDLLLYNGLDSLLTYKVAMKQMKILSVRKGKE